MRRPSCPIVTAWPLLPSLTSLYIVGAGAPGFAVFETWDSTDQVSFWDSCPTHVWQARFYDFNVWTERKRVEKLRYLHRNPVKRGLVSEPQQWSWSSFRHYMYGEVGPVRVNDTAIMKMRVRPPAV